MLLYGLPGRLRGQTKMSRFISHIKLPVSKLILLASAVVASALAVAETGTIKAGAVIRSSPPKVMDTRSFFPQVNVTVSQKRITPRNPSLSMIWRDKTPNGRVGGGVGGTTTGIHDSMFPGIDFTGWIPADPQIAVSKTHIVQVTNSDIAFFSKTGTKQFQQGMGPNSFFSGVGAGNFTFDPKVFFDAGSGRFFVVCLDEDDTAKTSAFLIAVSDDSDPNGKWTKYKVDNKYKKDAVEAWLDYEGWGFNKDTVVATGNMFTFGGGYAGLVRAFVFKKSEMLAGQTLNVVPFDDPGTFTIQVAKMDDKISPYVFGCSLDGSNSSSAIRVYAWRKIAATPGYEMVFTSISVPDFSFVGTPPSAGGAFLSSLSGRLVDATYRTGSLLTCHTTRAMTGANRSQLSWYEFRPGSWPASGSPTLFQSGDVALPGNNWAFIPGINKNSLGDISMIFTRSSDSIIADVMGVARKATDPKGQMGIPFQMASSDAAYQMSGRWGDYVSTCVDPSDDTTFWGNTMKSNSTGGWGTSIVKWKVSTGGGGGNNGIKPDAVSTEEGSYASGNIISIKNNDGSTYDANALKKTDGSYATSVQATFTLAVQKNTVAGVEIMANAFVSPARIPVGYLFLWNYDTSRWDYIKSFNLSGTAKVNTGSITTNGSQYVSSAKKVKVLFRALDPTRRNGYSPGQFKLKSDSIQIVVTQK